MRIGIVPTLYGYSAVVLPPYKGNWELLSPVNLSSELKIQLRGQILAALAAFSHSMTPWTNMLKVALPWAIWGGTALYMRLVRYMEMDLKFVILYGWIMFLFFGDGLFALGRFIYQSPNLYRAWNIRRNIASENWAIVENEIPKRPTPLENETEREYIDRVADKYPETQPFYKEMVTKEQPLAFRYWPLGLRELVVYLFVGPRIPPPHVVLELGERI
ncbi:hypothetical protein KA005_13545 [bacterium]|nr:hypothetical protein [bacterium]